jgi:hypothetical protein
MSKRMNMYLATRVTESTRTQFTKKARKYGDPGAVLRELIEAFVDNRITIERDPNRATMEKLYNEH